MNTILKKVLVTTFSLLTAVGAQDGLLFSLLVELLSFKVVSIFYPVDHIQQFLKHTVMLKQPLGLWTLSSIEHEHIVAYKRINYMFTASNQCREKREKTGTL